MRTKASGSSLVAGQVAGAGIDLRDVRHFHGLTLADVAKRAGVSRQFLANVENGADPIPLKLREFLATELEVHPDTLGSGRDALRSAARVHISYPLPTKLAVQQKAIATAKILNRLIEVIDQHVELPRVGLSPTKVASYASVELCAEKIRVQAGVGFGPLFNVTAMAEQAGAIVIRSKAVDSRIDAISFVANRPLVMLGTVGQSSSSERLAVGRELGFFALEIPRSSHVSAFELANHFGISLLLPRDTFGKECDRVLRSGRLCWAAVRELRLRWGVSKAIILERCHQLGRIDAGQLRTGLTALRRHGEAVTEQEDHLVAREEPGMVIRAMRQMNEQQAIYPATIARLMGVRVSLLEGLLGQRAQVERNGKVIPLFGLPSINQ